MSQSSNLSSSTHHVLLHGHAHNSAQTAPAKPNRTDILLIYTPEAENFTPVSNAIE